MSTAAIGHGSQFQIGGVSVAGVIAITPPPISQDAVESTDMDSEDGWREYIAGLRTAGELQIEINYIAGGPAEDALLGLFDGERHDLGIIFPNAVEWTFSAVPTNFEPGLPMDDKQTASFTAQVSGKPSFIA